MRFVVWLVVACLLFVACSLCLLVVLARCSSCVAGCLLCWGVACCALVVVCCSLFVELSLFRSWPRGWCLLLVCCLLFVVRFVSIVACVVCSMLFVGVRCAWLIVARCVSFVVYCFDVRCLLRVDCWVVVCCWLLKVCCVLVFGFGVVCDRLLRVCCVMHCC